MVMTIVIILQKYLMKHFCKIIMSIYLQKSVLLSISKFISIFIEMNLEYKCLKFVPRNIVYKLSFLNFSIFSINSFFVFVVYL